MTTTTRTGSLAVLAILLAPGLGAGCHDETKRATKETTAPASRTAPARTAPGRSPGQPPKNGSRQTANPRLGTFPRASQEQLQALGKGITEFSLGLYKQVANRQGNLFFSPWSISMALAMAHLGARGKTAAEMEQALHFPKTGLDQSFGTLFEKLTTPSAKGPRIDMANRIFPSKGFAVLSAYVQALRRYYATTLQALDFGDPEKAAATINAWVEARTMGRIPNLLQPGDLSDLTKFVLVNTIYFKGTWKKPFDKRATSKKAFYPTPKSPVQVDTMFGLVEAGYKSLPGFQVLSLPYAGNRISMVIFLPDEKDGLQSLEKKLDARMLQSAVSHLPHTKVVVFLPKFHAKQRLQLRSILQKLGIHLAFSKEADFSGITATKPGIFISAVIHEANCDVDERGTVAAAATALVAKGTGAPRSQPPPTFRADHPFLFFIRDDASGAILFMGRIVKP